MRVNAIVVAAGKGERMGAPLPKPFLPLCGVPLLVRTLRGLEQSVLIEKVVAVVAPGWEDLCREVLATHGVFRFPVQLARGGRERQDSVRSGLAALDPDCEVVVIHDAARPFITGPMVDRSIAAAAAHGGALVAVPAKDTVKRVDAAGAVLATVPREGLWLAQTPQTFRVALIRAAHARTAETGVRVTDDAALVEAVGGTVKVVPGDPLNLKVTTPEDMRLAEAIIRGGGSP